VSRWGVVRHIAPLNQQTSGSALFGSGFIRFGRVVGEAPIIVNAATHASVIRLLQGFLLEVEKLWLIDSAAFTPLVQEWRWLITG
jgi:hypothetical protein